MTPADAIQAGSDYLVVGRPISRAEDPGAAADAVVAEIEEALNLPPLVDNTGHRKAASFGNFSI